MSDIVVEFENLSKPYLIGYQQYERIFSGGGGTGK